MSGEGTSIPTVLRELHISGLGVIADLDLELGPGLNVLTGETGAGKTMVTVGLLLALGERGSASLVRDGAPAARVQARFDAIDGAGDWAEDGELILARSIGKDGRSTARIVGSWRRPRRSPSSAADSSSTTDRGRRNACSHRRSRRASSTGTPATPSWSRSARIARRTSGSGASPPSSRSCRRPRGGGSENSTSWRTRCARSRPSGHATARRRS